MKKLWLISAVLGLLTGLTIFAYISQENKKEVMEPVEKPKEEASETTAPEEDKNNKSNLPITYGKRALTIAADEVQGLGGVLKKDDYVDVILLVTPESGETAFSQIILEQIKVLSVGSYRPRVQSETENAAESSVETPETVIPYALVTLEVLPQEGATLALAAEKGKVVLMLRSRKDPTTARGEPVTLEQLNKGETVE